MDTAVAKPRRAWLAALLSLLVGPLGQVYVGRFRRSVVLWLVEISLSFILVFASISLPIGRFGFALLLMGLLSFRIFLAFDACLLARRNRDAPLKRYQRWWVYIILVMVLGIANTTVAHAIRSFIVEAFVIPARSMSPTIQPGDRILVDKFWTNAEHIQRNDIVVFRSDGPNSPMFVKRVAGLPGDIIEIKNECVLINGTPSDDTNAVFSGPLPTHVDIANYGPITIPSDCFFVLGDNRRFSKDSRILGPIPLSDFHGKACMIYWSQQRRFPDPHDTSSYTLGPIRWDRMGTRLD